MRLLLSQKFAIQFVIGVTVSVFVACASSDYHRGRSLLQKRNYVAALRLLTQAEKKKPYDYRIKREIGITLIGMKKSKLAVLKLKEAKAINPRDDKTVFYLGMAYEAANNTGRAIEEYKAYESQNRPGNFSKLISKRIRQLNRRKIATEIAIALENEDRLNPARFPENTIAVLNFENMSELPELEPLRKGLADLLITDLAKVKDLNVVERLKLQHLLDEIELGGTERIDEGTAPRVGHLLGARKLVKGGFTNPEATKLHIETYLTEIDTRKLRELENISGKMASLFKMEKQLALGIVHDLGINLTKEEREAILKIPTESLLAFLAYSKGLDYEDKGMFDKAKAEFQKAVAIDPEFEMAKESLENVSINESAVTDPLMPLAQLEETFAAIEPETSGINRSTRLLLTGVAAHTGQTPEGDNDSREPVAEGTGADVLSSDATQIEITIPLPDN